MKTLHRWLAKCTSSCKNSEGPTQLIFVTETNDKPDITCGPCNAKPIIDISYIDSYTVIE